MTAPTPNREPRTCPTCGRTRRDTITYWLTVATVAVVGALAVTLLAAIWIGIKNAMVP